MPAPPSSARVRRARIGPLDAVVDHRADGSVVVRSPHALGPYAAKLTERFEHWATHAPERTFLAQRGPDGAWRHLTYADARGRARRIAQALLDRGLSAERPVAILSGNGIEHGLLALGAMYAGVPYAPIAPAYSLIAREYGTLRYLMESLRPGLVYVSDGEAYARALRAVVAPDVEIVVGRGADPSTALGMTAGADPSTPLGMTAGVIPSERSESRDLHLVSSVVRAATAFSELEARAATAEVDAAHAAVGPETMAKVLFTSGSTGRPKGVITTQ